MIKKLLMLSLFCVGCGPNFKEYQTNNPQKNSRIKITESRSITENTEVGILVVDNVEYIVIYKQTSDGGVAVIKHEKSNKAEAE